MALLRETAARRRPTTTGAAGLTVAPPARPRLAPIGGPTPPTLGRTDPARLRARIPTPGTPAVGTPPPPDVTGSIGATRPIPGTPAGQLPPTQPSGPTPITPGIPGIVPPGEGPTPITPSVGPTQAPSAGGRPETSNFGSQAITQFDRENNLISSQINPLATDRLRGTRGAVDEAAQAFGTAAPDRGELARREFARFREEDEPNFQARVRDIGRNAATFGRIGSGVTTTRLGDLGLERERDINRRFESLSDRAAGQTLGDRFQQLSGLAGLEAQQSGQGFRERGELRGERGFQEGLDRRGVEDQIRQRLLENQEQGTAFDQQFAQQNLLGQQSFGQSPIELALAQGIGQRGQGTQDAIARMLQALGQSRA